MNPILVNLSRGALGMSFLILVCYLLSNNRRAINWKLVGMGLFAQVMFAMGVLHTTVFGQPVFWLLFGAILAYTIFNKFNRVRNKVEGNHITYNAPNLLLVFIWQVILVVGIILAPRLFDKWTNLSIFLSCIALLVLIFRVGKKHGELMKWSILLSCVILTAAVYTQVCDPRIFKIILQSVSNVFVSLINISHKGTEFMFGALADPNQSWAYVFAIQVLPNIIFFAALSSTLASLTTGVSFTGAG